MSEVERDWESMARARLEKLVAEMVRRIREAADEIEREAKRNIESAAEADRALEFQTYRSKLRAFGQSLAEEYGWRAVEDGAWTKDRLDLAGLLSPADAIDDREDRASIEFVQSHVRWLLS